MSYPKVKPSIAARELAMRLFASDHGMSHMDKLPQFDTLRSRHQIVVEKYEALIQAALGDLLEKAQTLNVYIEARWGDSDATIQGLNRPLKSSLEPWKVGE